MVITINGIGWHLSRALGFTQPFYIFYLPWPLWCSVGNGIAEGMSCPDTGVGVLRGKGRRLGLGGMRLALQGFGRVRGLIYMKQPVSLNRRGLTDKKLVPSIFL